MISIAASSQAFASQKLCETYAREFDTESKNIEEVRSYVSAEELSDSQKAMVQIAILMNNISKPISSASSLKEFFSGADAGSLNYYNVKISGKTYKLARVTYYPGDNEYGALFQLSGNEEIPSLLATVEDSEISCLSYVEYSR
jgi:hypothetical protein